MKKETVMDLIGRVFETMLPNMNIIGSYVLPKGETLSVNASPKSDTHCAYSSYGSYVMTLGKLLYPELKGIDPSSIPPSKNIIVNESSLALSGQFWHELAHALYTPMGLHKLVLHGMAKQNAGKFTQSFAQCFNMLEDFVIEKHVVRLRRDARDGLEFLLSLLYDSHTDMIQQINSTAPTTADQFYSFMFAKYRIGLPVSYPGFNAIAQQVNDAISILLNTTQPRLRLLRMLAFHKAIWDHFNLNEPLDFKEVNAGLSDQFYKNVPDKYKDDEEEQNGGQGNPDNECEDGEGGEGEGEGQGQDGEDGEDNDSNGNGSSSNGNPYDDMDTTFLGNVEDQTGTEDAQPQEMTAELPKGGKMEDLNKEVKTMEVKNTKMLANDQPPLGIHQYKHEFRSVAKNLRKGYKGEKTYQLLVKPLKRVINKLISVFAKLRRTNQGEVLYGTRTGKLNVRAATKPVPTPNMFQNYKAPKDTAEFAVHLVVDNSGSMYGDKAKIAAQGAIALGEMCHKLRIPFAVSMFTYSDWAITYEVKDFNESLPHVHSNLATMYDDVLPDSFYSNVDEVNLYYIGKKFDKRLEQDKILIVLSDGATCGSKSDLKQVVSELEQRFTVLGIGIRDRNVADVYSNSTILQTEEELNSLPKFMSDYLIKNYIKGGK